MPKTERKDIWFDSADGQSKIAGYFYSSPAVPPFCVLQLSHGMCEYVTRYAEFAAFLAENGVVMCGNDHLGHGASTENAGDLGYFSEKNGRRFALQDMKTMNEAARREYPGLPLVLLGHSMGSFFARRFAAEWPGLLDGLIISGTGGPNALAPVGIALARAIARLRGPRHRSALLHRMAFAGYLKRVENPETLYDWLSRDKAIVRAYAADPLCTFRFTANGFHELFCLLREVSSPQWAVGIRKDMPVLMIQGAADPVGNYGDGTAIVRDWLHGAGVKNLEYILYPGGRHEMLNETNREAVYRDVLRFIGRYFGTEETNTGGTAWQGEKQQMAHNEQEAHIELARRIAEKPDTNE